FFPNKNEAFQNSKKGIWLDAKYYQELLSATISLGDALGDEKIIARIQKNSSKEIWIKSCLYHGETRIDIRTYFLPEDSRDYCPTKKGVVLPNNLYPQLLNGVKKLGSEVKTKHPKLPENIFRESTRYILDSNGFLLTDEQLNESHLN
ncbi:MAG: hypothetical protein E4G94_12355, partial [ANME-2 cluster archaeon]